ALHGQEIGQAVDRLNYYFRVVRHPPGAIVLIPRSDFLATSWADQRSGDSVNWTYLVREWRRDWWGRVPPSGAPNRPARGITCPQCSASLPSPSLSPSWPPPKATSLSIAPPFPTASTSFSTSTERCPSSTSTSASAPAPSTRNPASMASPTWSSTCSTKTAT